MKANLVPSVEIGQTSSFITIINTKPIIIFIPFSNYIFKEYNGYYCTNVNYAYNK